MLQLIGTGDSLQVDSATITNVDCYASWVDYDGASVTPGNTSTLITAVATGQAVVPAPATASTYRRIKFLSLRNRGASSSVVTVKLASSGTVPELYKTTLAPEECLTYTEQTGFFKAGQAAVAYRNASLADAALTASAANYIPNSNLDFTNVKPGTRFRWRIGMSKTAAGIATQTFDVRVGINASTADTVRLGGASWATGTQTAAADFAVVEIVAIVRAVGATGTMAGYWLFSKNAATTTGFAPQATLTATGTSGSFDTTVAGSKIGVCTTPGASAAVTVNEVDAERIDP